MGKKKLGLILIIISKFYKVKFPILWVFSAYSNHMNTHAYALNMH